MKEVSKRYNFKDISYGRQKRTAFDISESKDFDCFIGSVIPAYVRYMNPGDTFKVKNRIVVRLNPMISPAFVKMEAVAHTFFVPFRLLWRDWEEYLTRGVSGDFTAIIPRMLNPLSSTNTALNQPHSNVPFCKYSFWDYMGLPIPSTNYNFGDEITTNLPNGTRGPAKCEYIDISNMSSVELPHNFAYSAYNMIYNEYYRDENLDVPRAYYMLSQGNGTALNGEATNPLNADNPFFKYSNFNHGTLPVYSLEKINGVEPSSPMSPVYIDSIFQVTYKKDYFTSALPFQQRGDAYAIPITANINANNIGLVANTQNTDFSVNFTDGSSNLVPTVYQAGTGTWNPDVNALSNGTTIGKLMGVGTVGDGNDMAIGNDIKLSSDFLNKLTTSGSVSGFSLTAPELYLMTSLQKWQQISARGGVRLNEFLLAMYGISPTDAVLQRPEYIGGMRSPIIVSDVIQQSQSTTDSELGQLAGYGVSASENFVGSYTAKEHGVLMTLFFITYEPTYQNAISKEFMYQDIYDWYFPSFVNLADDAVKQSEVNYQNNSTKNQMIYGYQGKYDELRTSFNKVAGSMRTNERGNWTAARRFTGDVALNSSMIHIKSDALKDLFQVQDEPPFIVHFDSMVTAIRPLPYHSNPQLQF